MPRILFTCEMCGKEATAYPSQHKRFCSRACMGKARTTGLFRGKPKTGRTDPCVVCSADVWRMPSDIAKGRRMTCSRKCADDLKRTAEWVECSCEQCGRDIGSRRRSEVARFCSRSCVALARIRRPLDRLHNGLPARLNSDGYVLVYEPDHPKSFASWMYEHRLIAEQMIGRPLRTEEVVHHVNRNKSDNRPSNLAVVDTKTHARLTAEERQSDRKLLDEYIRRYGPLD